MLKVNDIQRCESYLPQKSSSVNHYLLPEFPEFFRKYFHNTMISLIIWHFLSEPLYLFASLLPIVAYRARLPLPARPTLRVCARGWLSPSCLPSMGTPLLPANFAQRQRGSLKSQETPVGLNLSGVTCLAILLR